MGSALRSLHYILKMQPVHSDNDSFKRPYCPHWTIQGRAILSNLDRSRTRTTMLTFHHSKWITNIQKLIDEKCRVKKMEEA